MITYSDFDKIMQEVDDIEFMTPKVVGWFPTVANMEKHNVKKNFDQYAKFLFYISESMDADTEAQKRYDAETYKEFQATQKYIKNLFANFVIDDEIDEANFEE